MNKNKNYGACQAGFIVFTSISSGNVSPYKWTRFDPKINIYLKKTTGFPTYENAVQMVNIHTVFINGM
jgi:hypothetical protein